MGSQSRGVSSPLAVALLLVIVLAGMGLVVAMGATALDDTRDQLSTSRAEKVLTQLDSRSAMVALGGTNRQQVQFGDSGEGSDYYVRENAGWMNITVENTTTGDVTTVMNATLGAVVFENGAARLAYQGGGVWKHTEAGNSMVSPPEFHFRNATLTLPVIAVDGASGLSETAIVTQNGTTVQKFPNTDLDENFTNPLTNGKVEVTVHSDFYDAWGRYFEQRTQGEVQYDHGRRTASIELVVPVSGRRVRSAVAATSASGTMTLSGSGSEVARTDSYTSADGDGYTGDDHDGGNISVGGTLDVGGNACVIGSVRADTVQTRGNANNCPDPYKVTGDVYYVTREIVDPGDYGGTLTQFSGVEPDTRIDSLIDDRVETIRTDSATNTNGEVDATANELDFSGDDTAELGAGTYYVESLDVDDGETVEVDTTGGDVTIAVRQGIKMTGSAEIQVSGSGQLKIYVKGEGVGTEIRMMKDSGDAPRVNVPGRNSTQLWVYGKSGFSGTLKGSNEDVLFEGVVYAPGGLSGTGTVSVEKARIFGGLVASDVDISQGGEFHYDRALSRRRAVSKGENVVAITYLHITVNRINVTSS